MSSARLAGRVPGGSTGPLFVSFHGRRVRACWSGCLGQGGDPVPGDGDVSGPGPGDRDSQLAAATADNPGGGVQDAVTKGLGLGFGQVAVEGQVPQPGQERRGEQ